MCRGPLAYGHATAVSTRALMAPTLVRSWTEFPWISAHVGGQRQRRDTGAISETVAEPHVDLSL